MPTSLRSIERSVLLCATLVVLVSCDTDGHAPCGPGETLCGKRCVDLATDPAHCGACDATCGDGTVCDVGRCAEGCAAGTTTCGDRCRELDTDPLHCGACDNACEDAQVCGAGSCGEACGPALTDCGGVCRDLRSHRLHCGACDQPCDASEVCADGTCASACPDGLEDCGGTCRDVESDADNCGACGVLCEAGQVCSLGACADTCADGLTACGEDCVDVDTDARHCGGCDTPCPIGEGCGGGTCGDTEDPPVFTSTPVTTAEEDAAYTYEIVVEDLDAGDVLTITGAALPAWLTLTDVANGRATLGGTPEAGDVGTHAVRLVATDGTTEVEQAFDITVTEVDDLPVFLTSPALIADEDVPYLYTIEVEDEEGEPVTVSATTLPIWLTFTDVGDGTYTLTGTPTSAELGDHAVVLEATTGAQTATQSFTLTVANINSPPAFTSTPVTNATEDGAYAYAVTTADPDGPGPYVITASALPAWLTLVDATDGTATVAGTPANAHVGDHAVTLEVSDGLLTVTQTFTITVGNTNDAPTFTSDAATAATEDTPYTYAITATDEDIGDVIAISATGLPAWLTLTDDGDGAATLAGTPAQGDVGSVMITLVVTDEAGATGEQTFLLDVTAVDDPPAFTSTPITEATDGVAYTYSVVGTDEENGTLTLVGTTLPAWLTLTSTGNGTATLAGTPDDADVGDHTLELTLGDGSTSVTQTFTITVGDANDAPTFTSTPVTSATQDVAYTYAVTSADPDVGATLTITAPVLPAWLALTPSGNGTATLAGTPTNAHVGTHSVELSVSDGITTATQSFTITVGNTNDAPVFSSTPITAATEDALYTYAITATDPDTGTTLAISATMLPAWLVLTPTGNGTATLTGTPTNDHVGTHSVVLSVTDGTAPVTQSFTITVANTNDSPTFTSTPVTTVNALSAYTYAITTADVDVGDTRTITVTALPAWLSLVDAGNGTATLSGTPTSADAGVVMVTLTVNDGDATATQTFTITVQTQRPSVPNVGFAVIGNTELVAESSAAKNAVPRGNIATSSTVDLLTNVTDPDSAPSAFAAQLVSAPSNGNLVLHADGSFSYAPAAGYVGTDTFTYRVSDGIGFSSNATVTLTITSRVWYVNNLTNVDDPGAKNPLGGNGTSVDAFDTIAALDLAATFANDFVFVSQGDAPYTLADADGLDLLAGQTVIGQQAALVVNSVTLWPGAAGTRPTISSAAGHVVTLSASNTLAGLGLTCSTGACVRGTGAANTTLTDVTMSLSGSAKGVELASHTGSFTHTGGSIGATALGTTVAVAITGSSSPVVSFVGVPITGVALGFSQSTSGADVSFGAGMTLTTGGRAIEVTSAATGGSLTVSAPITATNVASGSIIAITAGAADYDVRFAGLTLSGASAGDALALTSLGASSTIDLDGTTSIGPVGGQGLFISGSTGVFGLDDVRLANVAGTDVRIDGGGPSVNLTLGGVTGIANTAGSAFTMSNTANANVVVAGASISDTALGMTITNNSGGSVRFDPSVSLMPATGSPALVASSNGTMSIRFGTLNVTSTNARGISVTGASRFEVVSGTLSASGALGLEVGNVTTAAVALTSAQVTNTTGTGGIRLSNLGGGVALGTVTLTTTGGDALWASSAGSLGVTNGTINATNGTAVSLVNTTIAAAGVTLTSASASNATSGIVLTNTGTTGDFTITGSGSTLASGGTISGMSGGAVRLDTVDGVHLTNVTLTNNAGGGIMSTTGARVVDLDLTRLRISGSGDAPNEGGVYITTSLEGGCDFNDVNVTGSSENAVQVTSGAGTLTWNVTGSRFELPGNTFGANGVVLDVRGAANATATFASCAFAENEAVHLLATALDTSRLTLNVTSSTFLASATKPTETGIALASDDAANVRFDFNGNGFTGPSTVSPVTSHAAVVISGGPALTASAELSGHVRNSTTMTNHNFGVLLDIARNAVPRIAITNNTMTGIVSRAIDYLSGTVSGDTAVGHLTITGNTCAVTSSAGTRCLYVTPTLGTSVCTNVRSNTLNVAGGTAVEMIGVAASQSRIESAPTDCGGACASASAHVMAQNAEMGSVLVVNTGLVAPGTCLTPL